MSVTSTYRIYNASAGSGKTFTLVKEYLQVLLQHKDPRYFQKMLAITFTNKAAAEMKERILNNLQAFAGGSSTDMLAPLQKATGPDAPPIQKRSAALVEAILQNYSAFHITTIDSFTHRIIRSFSYDFGLSLDFEVETDGLGLLREAVAMVISQIGVNQRLTKALVSYSLYKSGEDKAWDISKTLNEFASVLLDETDRTAFQSIADIDFDDYIQLQKKLTRQLTFLSAKLQNIGKEALRVIKQTGLKNRDFYRSMLPNHFTALFENWEKAKFFDQSVLRERIDENTYYSKSKPKEVKKRIENCLPRLLALYFESEQIYSRITLLKLFRSSIVPLSVLSFVHKALEKIQSDTNVRLLSEFNSLIFEKIKNEPTPFIYERLGENFRHYFIDEMQDTSVLQWKNLIKLIDNALSQGGGSLLLVGDAKQAIYRWRGGASKQFIDLSDTRQTTPFQVTKKVEELQTNYRSFSEIIGFNNSFFQHISGFLQKAAHIDLYRKGNRQKTNKKTGGYVEIAFLKKENAEEAAMRYPQKVLETIQNLDPAFQWKDVCVLTRKNKDTNEVATYLSEKGLAVISPQSLRLETYPKVLFLIDTLQSLLYPNDKNSRFGMLDFLHSHRAIKTDKHLFYKELLDLNTTSFYNLLQEYGIDFQKDIFYKKPLYDAIEYVVRTFRLNDSSDLYLQTFLDVVLEFQIQKGSDIMGFLEYWEQQKNDLSIGMPEGQNAVQVMTIHKAKGLQFPVVIFPCDLDIYYEKDPKVWYPIEEVAEFQGFEQLMIPANKQLKYTGDTGQRLFRQREELLELDNYNLLYVAMTRAIEQLYIITDYRLNKDGEENTRYYSGLYINYLKHQEKWDAKQLVYSFGKKQRVRLAEDKKETEVLPSLTFQQFISNDITKHQVEFYTYSSLLWDIPQEKALTYGNLLHNILAHIKTEDDVEMVIQRFVDQGVIKNSERGDIHRKIVSVVTHSELSAFFQQDLRVYCEREILSKEGQIIIPDRLILYPNNELAILDYKTGSEQLAHKTQLENYANVLGEMGYRSISKSLIYIGESVKVKKWV